MTEEVFEFGPYRLEPSRGRLLRDGQPCALPPKIFAVLTMLVEAGGRLVTKEQLLAAIWPGTFVEEGSLTYTVSTLRKLLCEAGAPGFIETVPKRGYRFKADVAQVPVAAPRAVTRLMVLPFTMLRPDPEVDFLARGLPDAIAGALSGLQSLIVRSTIAERPLAESGVDLALAGSVMRSGDQVRVITQLLEGASGTLIWSRTLQVTLGELFHLQDELQRRIVESLALPLTPQDQQRLARRGPATARAYEFYLRGSQLAYEPHQWPAARDLLLQSVDDDPAYAPAWARLARCYRVIGKYSRQTDERRDNLARAASAFERALTLNPDLSIAHNLYAQLEVDLGRAPDAMVRLLQRARTHGTDPETFAGLVHALRFCGLLDESIAAHQQARQLDRSIPTSVAHTYWLTGDYEGALKETYGDIGYMPGLALLSLGRADDALAALRWREQQAGDSQARLYLTSLRALLEDRRTESLDALDALVTPVSDAEALHYVARTFARWGEHDRALAALRGAVAGGFTCPTALRSDPWLRTLGGDAFEDVVISAERARREALDRFRDAGGSGTLTAA